NNSTAGTVIRFEAGTYIFNYNGYFSKKIMLQGGWNPSKTLRDPFAMPTILNGQSSAEIINISWIDGDGSFILDGIRMHNGGGYNGTLKFIMKQSPKGKISLNDCVIQNSIS